MQLTAAVINAGLGDLSLGLELAGFNVIAAYDSEDKAINIHRFNLGASVYHLPLEEIETESFPHVDLLAAHIHFPSYSQVNYAVWERHEASIHRLQEILIISRPRAFFLLINTASIKNERVHYFLEDTVGQEYKLSWKLIDVAQLTGFPVKENMACVVGIERAAESIFEFPSSSNLPNVPFSQFMEHTTAIDPWYYRIKLNSTPIYEDWHQLFCWKNHAYFGTDLVQWNFMRIPLLRDDAGLRKMTHREIANLKGFPQEYDIPCHDRQWLYKKLIYSGNILVIQQIAGMISYSLSSNPWRAQKKERGYQVERIFGLYLEKLKEKAADNAIILEQDFLMSEQPIDFAFQQGNNTFYFEVKYSLTSRVKALCKHLASLKESGTPILVIANEVPSDIKEEFLSQYGIYIWDVENLLWLFSEFPEIKNEFIAFLEYSTELIEPKPPKPEIFQNYSAQKSREPDLKEKLLKVAPGHKQFQDYEAICIDILKYVLGDYLTLWETQESSNDGLYRFDLCCKIKNGADQDFFDTIKHYFNTKYIVFEFKNHRDKITQKEIYTTEKYLYEKALRKVAIIISRSGADDHALQAAKGALRETGKLILCLSDNSLMEMIDIKTRGDQEPAEFLGAILDDILVHLEK